MYSDGYPYLLCNDRSVDQINQDVGKDLATWENFRPNILVTSTQGPYVEVVLFCIQHSFPVVYYWSS